MTEDDNYPEGVLRQRRNFLLASAVLAAFLFLEIEFTEIQIFGIKFILQNKENFVWIVFAWWCYLLWGYYQYQREIRDTGISHHYFNVVSYFATPIITKEASKTYPNLDPGLLAHYHCLKPISLLRSKYTGQLHFREPEKTYLVIADAPFEICRLKLIHAHLLAFIGVMVANHRVSDFLLPYAIGGLLFILFISKYLPIA